MKINKKIAAIALTATAMIGVSSQAAQATATSFSYAIASPYYAAASKNFTTKGESTVSINYVRITRDSDGYCPGGTVRLIDASSGAQIGSSITFSGCIMNTKKNFTTTAFPRTYQVVSVATGKPAGAYDHFGTVYYNK